MGYALVLLCAVLKLFPIFGFTLALRERMRTGVAVLAGAAAAFGAYLFVTRDDVRAIISNSIQGVYLSYGRKVLLERLRDYGLAVDPSIYSLVLVAIVAAAAVALALLFPLPEFTRGAMEKMLVGTGIYCGSFVLLSNFNYRLIFVLLVVPQLLVWWRLGAAPRRIASAALATIAVALLLSGQLRSWLFLLKETANWLLFASPSGCSPRPHSPGLDRLLVR